MNTKQCLSVLTACFVFSGCNDNLTVTLLPNAALLSTPSPSATSSPAPSPAPYISSITPFTSPTKGGVAVTLAGLHFSPKSVLFYPVSNPSPGASPSPYPCQISLVASQTSTSITCITSAQPAGKNTVTVVNRDNQRASLFNSFTFTAPKPTFLTTGPVTPCPSPSPIPNWGTCPNCPVNPSTGSNLANSRVTFTGTDFQKGATIYFGGYPCVQPSYSLNSCPQQISCQPQPVVGSGVVPVTVVNPDNQSDTIPYGYQFLISPPTSMTYLTNPAWYSVGAKIINNIPIVSGGTPSAYSIFPSLPAGLSFDTSSGRISGTPTVAAPSASYLVTAINSGGSITTTLNLAVGEMGNGSFGSYTANVPGETVNNYVHVRDAQLNSGATSISVSSLSGYVSNSPPFAPGNLVLVIQSQSSATNRIVYEYARISTVSAASGSTSAKINLKSPLLNSYTSNTFSQASSAVTQVVQVPEFTDVTVPLGTSITAPVWNGREGGIVAFRATGTVTVNGIIDASGVGYRGGIASSSSASGGETFAGFIGSASAPPYSDTANGGGGGASVAGTNQRANGGGGSYDGAGTAGAASAPGTSGSPGTVFSSGSLMNLFFGSGGGGSASSVANCPGVNGSRGGGLILISAQTIQIGANGLIQSNGANAETSPCGGGAGGAGAGGSIYLSAPTQILRTNLVTTLGGVGSSNGGSGGKGRIRLDYDTISGTPSPLPALTGVPFSTFNYGVNPMNLIVGVPFPAASVTPNPFKPTLSFPANTTFSIFPALPTGSGINFDTTTGAFSGTPALGTFLSYYTITASTQGSQPRTSSVYMSVSDFGSAKDGYGNFAAGTTTTINNYARIIDRQVVAGNTTFNISSLNTGGAFRANDQIMIIQMQNAYSSSLPWEFAKIRSITTGTDALEITTTTPLKYTYLSGTPNTYPSGIPTTTAPVSAQIVKVMEYVNVNLPSTATLSAPAWDGAVGGVIAFQATGTAVIDGTVNASSIGYRGGRGVASPSPLPIAGFQGESWNRSGIASPVPNLGGGGGGYITTTPASASGGGGGYGSAGAPLSSSLPNGTGGAEVGLPDLSALMLGSGGGGSSTNGTGCLSANGSRGGGIVLIYANNLKIGGSILANGENTLGETGGSCTLPKAGGSGSGGSILIKSLNLNLAPTGTLSAIGGNYGTTDTPKVGGLGGQGRIRIDAPYFIGATGPSPTPNSGSIAPPPGFTLPP